MAKIIGQGGRIANRFTGRQWGSGYQYRPALEFVYEVGPWRAVAPTEAQYDPDALWDLTDGYILGGSVVGCWAVKHTDVSIETGYEMLGTFFFTINNEDTHFQFYRDTATGYLKIGSEYITASQTDTSTITLTTQNQICAQPWGDKIYFGQNGLDSLYVYDKDASTITAVAGSPSNVQHLLVIDNNLVAIFYDTSDEIWKAQWAVDSDPTDWSGTGSGSNPLASSLGDIQAFVKHDRNGVVVGEYAALLMLPTGTVPTFQFDEAPAFAGCINKYCADTDGRGICYIGHDRQFHYWRPSSDTIINEQWGTRIQGAPDVFRIAFSKHLGRYIAHVQDTANSDQYYYIIDHKTQTIAGRTETAAGTNIMNFVNFMIADGWVEGERGVYMFFSKTAGSVRNEYKTHPDSNDVTAPSLIHKMSFGVEVEITEIQYLTTIANTRHASGAIIIDAYQTQNASNDDYNVQYTVDPDDGFGQSSGKLGAQVYRIPCQLHGHSFSCVHTFLTDLNNEMVRKIRYIGRVLNESDARTALI